MGVGVGGEVAAACSMGYSCQIHVGKNIAEEEVTTHYRE